MAVVALAGVHAHTELFDLPAQNATAPVVDLHRHQPRREFDHVGLQSKIVQRLGRLQTEQATADHDAATRVAAGVANGFRSSMVR